MSREEDMAEAILGRDAAQFCRSELGQVLIGRAKAEKDDALQELAKTSPWRIFKGFELRNAAWRAESFEKWLGELIVNGVNAERNMEHGQSTEES